MLVMGWRFDLVCVCGGGESGQHSDPTRGLPPGAGTRREAYAPAVHRAERAACLQDRRRPPRAHHQHGFEWLNYTNQNPEKFALVAGICSVRE